MEARERFLARVGEDRPGCTELELRLVNRQGETALNRGQDGVLHVGTFPAVHLPRHRHFDDPTGGCAALRYR